MNVLVVGGTGYIGGSVSDILLEKKIPFTVYDNLTYEKHYLKSSDFIFGDVRDKEKLGKLLKKYTHVIWLAALVGDGACEVHRETSEEINAKSIKWLAGNFKGRVVFTSTCSVYGQNDHWLDENSPVSPLSTYARTKLEAESYLIGENALIFRLGTAYGLSDHYARLRLDLAVNYMTALAIRSGKLFVFGGAQWRPFVHVRDIARTIVLALPKNEKGVFNLATDNLTIKDLALIVKKETGCKIEYIPQKFQDQRNYHVRTTKALKSGLIPSNPKRIIDGVKEIATIVRASRIKNIEDEIYSNAKYLKTIYEKNGCL